MADEDYRKIQLIMSLRNQGIRDTNVLRALEKVPREAFVPPSFVDRAYEDQSLPIECGQTISQPYVVAYMTEKLQVADRDKVLEIGTGSGYQTAVLAQLCRRVYTMERYRTLTRAAEQRLADMRLVNVTYLTGDGYQGWPQQAPFDRIIVTAAAPDIPNTLVDQLKEGGIMILPVDVPTEELEQPYQQIVRVTKTEYGLEEENLIDVRFVPMVPGVAREM